MFLSLILSNTYIDSEQNGQYVKRYTSCVTGKELDCISIGQSNGMPLYHYLSLAISLVPPICQCSLSRKSAVRSSCKSNRHTACVKFASWGRGIEHSQSTYYHFIFLNFFF
jgi:hypothetical protein